MRGLLLLAPFIFVAHFVDEGPEFVTWFNRHVTRGITPELFWSVNYAALAITIVVVAAAWVNEGPVSDALVVAWVSFLMLANGILHVVGSLADGAPMPGVLTAVGLYLPFSALVLARVIRARRLPPAVVAATAAAGAAPMLIHGYLIVFRGSRLF